eukprot:8781456-Alexandrium_andersonii.AAC.1
MQQRPISSGNEHPATNDAHVSRLSLNCSSCSEQLHAVLCSRKQGQAAFRAASRSCGLRLKLLEM